MKSLLYFLVIGLLLISCNDSDTSNKTISDSSSENEEKELTIEGAWELTGYYNYFDNKVTDSFTKNAGLRQVKMYTPTRVMWSKSVPSDSSEWFGYGTYVVRDGELTEILDYGSEMMSKIIEERKEFVYELIIEPNQFTQIELDDDGNRIYSENYKRIE